MSHHGVGDALVAELSAEFVPVHGIEADGVLGLVHQGAVSERQHVTAQGWVDGGADMGGLIGGIPTIIVSVTLPCGIDTSTVGALPFLLCIAHTSQLIGRVLAIIVSITLPPGVDTFGLVGAVELIRSTRGRAVLLVPAISAVIVAVTDPGLLDTQVVVALDLASGTLHLGAI